VRKTNRLGARERLAIELKTLFYRTWLEKAVYHTMTPERAKEYWDYAEIIRASNQAQLQVEIEKQRRLFEEDMARLPVDLRSGRVSSEVKESVVFFPGWIGELNKNSYETVGSCIQWSVQDKSQVFKMTRARLETIAPKALVMYEAHRGEMREYQSPIPFGAWMELDFWGVCPNESGDCVYLTPHVNLYEDMAYHYNQAVELLKASATPATKPVGASHRAALVT